MENACFFCLFNIVENKNHRISVQISVTFKFQCNARSECVQQGSGELQRRCCRRGKLEQASVRAEEEEKERQQWARVRSDLETFSGFVDPALTLAARSLLLSRVATTNIESLLDSLIRTCVYVHLSMSFFKSLLQNNIEPGQRIGVLDQRPIHFSSEN